MGTSPILADTDGDQLDDRDELLNRSRNPHIADLPIVDITVGEINLELDQRYSFTDQFGEEQQFQQSYSSTLQRDTSSSLSNTSSDTYRAHIENKLTVATGIEGQLGGGVHSGGYVKTHLSVQNELSAVRIRRECPLNGPAYRRHGRGSRAGRGGDQRLAQQPQRPGQ